MAKDDLLNGWIIGNLSCSNKTPPPKELKQQHLQKQTTCLSLNRKDHTSTIFFHIYIYIYIYIYIHMCIYIYILYIYLDIGEGSIPWAQSGTSTTMGPNNIHQPPSQACELLLPSWRPLAELSGKPFKGEPNFFSPNRGWLGGETM